MLVRVAPDQWLNLAYVSDIRIEELSAATGASGFVARFVMADGRDIRTPIWDSKAALIENVSSSLQLVQGRLR